MSVLWPSLYPTQPGPHSRDLFDVARPSDAEPSLITPSLLDGQKAGSGIVDESPRELVAAIWPGVNDTFYNRILIEPAQLEMGNLLSNQTRPIVVWNGFLTNKALQAFQTFNDDGIAVTQPVAVPYTLRPLEQLTYVLSISTDGPATINATYRWTVDGLDYFANVTGRRVVIWPFGPTWDSPVTESLAWLTNILRSFSGKEQRRGLRTKPRRSFSYNFKVFREDSQRLENLLWGWQNRIYALPVWTDRPRLQQDALAGASLINLPTATYSFAVGDLAIIYANNRKMEVVEINAIEANAILTERPLEGDWPRGTRVMPVVLGHLPTSVAMARHTSQAISGSLQFDTDPTSTTPYIPGTVAPVSYNSREVIMRQPNWAAALSNSFNFDFDTLDQQTGAIRYDTTESFPRIQRSYTWLLNGRQQIADFRSMLGRRMGQRTSMYVPSWHDDLRVTRAIGAADVGIYVDAGNDFRLMVGQDDARDRIMVRLRDGSYFFRRITGVSTDGSDTALSIDSPFNREITVDQIKTIHFLMCSRLATDQVDIVWRTGQAATVETTLTTILE